MVQIEGESDLNGRVKLETRDGLEVSGPGLLTVTATSTKSHIILIEMAK